MSFCSSFFIQLKMENKKRIRIVLMTTAAFFFSYSVIFQVSQFCSFNGMLWISTVFRALLFSHFYIKVQYAPRKRRISFFYRGEEERNGGRNTLERMIEFLLGVEFWWNCFHFNSNNFFGLCIFFRITESGLIISTRWNALTHYMDSIYLYPLLVHDF